MMKDSIIVIFRFNFLAFIYLIICGICIYIYKFKGKVNERNLNNITRYFD